MKRQPATAKGDCTFRPVQGFALLGLPFVNVLALWLIATPETAADFYRS